MILVKASVIFVVTMISFVESYTIRSRRQDTTNFQSSMLGTQLPSANYWCPCSSNSAINAYSQPPPPPHAAVYVPPVPSYPAPSALPVYPSSSPVPQYSVQPPPAYQPSSVPVPKPIYSPPPAAHYSSAASPAKCPQNILIGCHPVYRPVPCLSY